MQAASSPAPADVPSSNERLLAGFAHVGAVLGPLLIVPIVIYFLQRGRSDFVTQHAVRAIRLYLWSVFAIVMGMIVCMMIIMNTVTLVSPTMWMLMFAGMYGLIALACLVYLVLATIAMVRAFSGEIDRGITFAAAKGPPPA